MYSTEDSVHTFAKQLRSNSLNNDLAGPAHSITPEYQLESLSNNDETVEKSSNGIQNTLYQR